MLDILFAIMMIAAFIKGWRMGLIVGLFSIVAFIVGIAAALKLSAIVAVRLKENITVSDKWLPFIAFATVFIIVAVAVNWAGRIIQQAFEMALMGWINKIGGVVFYMALYIFIFSVLLFFAEKIHLISEVSIGKSAVYKFVQPWGPAVINNLGKIIPVFKEMFTQLESFFESLSDNLR
jgi:membrane protein required for colicin V production